MVKSRKKRRNKYRESRINALRGKIRKFRPFYGFFAGICLVLLLGAGLCRLYRALLDTPWLKVEEIEMAGLKELGRAEVLDAMGVARGESIFNLRMQAIAERVRRLPVVKTASARFDPPGKIVVEITERQPVALIQGSVPHAMDEEGVLFAKICPEENRTLPLITGLCRPDLEKGDSIPAQSLAQARKLLSALEKSGSWLPAGSVRECRWNEAGGFTLILGERGIPVDIGREDYHRKFSRLRMVIDTLNERQWSDLVTRIDLDYPGKAFLSGRFPVAKPVQGNGKAG